jgi:transcriptional regulator with XRE-family HTH domain
MELNYYEIGQRIRRYRKACGLSQEQLAEKAAISPTHMSHIETGSTKLSLPVFINRRYIIHTDRFAPF